MWNEGPLDAITIAPERWPSMSETHRPDDDTDVQPTYPRFGPFLLVEAFTHGGMGQLHLARTPWPDRPVAVVKSLLTPKETDFVSVERFRHEAELAVRLRHPNLAETYHVGRVAAGLYVAVEPVLGRDALAIARTTRARKLDVPADVMIPILRDVLTALAYVHEVPVGDGRQPGIVHRDVTPGNVIVGYDGRTKLVDFGIAKSALTERYDLTQDFVIGTPSYLAPEIVLGDPPTTASDIYGAGAVAYRLLTGTPPFLGKGTEVLLKAVSEQPRPLETLRPDLPAELVALVQAMMATNMTKRIRTARVALERLERFAGPPSPHEAATVASWLSVVFAKEREKDEARMERVRAIAHPDAAAWSDVSRRFVHDEAQPTIGASPALDEGAGDATMRAEAATVDPATPWDPTADPTVRHDSDAEEHDDTLRPENEEPADLSDWHIARPPQPRRAKPTFLLPTVELPRRPEATPALSKRTVILLLLAASIVSGVIGAVLGLYFAGS